MTLRIACLLPLCCMGVALADHGLSGKAPLFTNLGTRHHKVTTSVEDAQRYFDQGLTLCWAFNHSEAIRSFERAAKLDPDCAMAHWGIAFANGPNINMPMEPAANTLAYAAVQRALSLVEKVSLKERAYIEAISRRYTKDSPKDRAKLDKAFADAMHQLAKSYPDDLDAAVLAAEATMDTMPWAYWSEDGKPNEGTREMLASLERVMKADPKHPGANHYYIHAVEASPNPELGLPAAHRLGDLVPGSGHLVHMPSHIYLRLGMYHEASVCNDRAVAVDEEYMRKYKIASSYTAMYYTHNVHFLWYSTAMEGRRDDSIRAARKTAEVVSPEVLKMMPESQWPMATPFFALARFGLWEEILREPAPPEGQLFVRMAYHYARGMTHARKREPEQARAELDFLKKVVADDGFKKLETPSLPGPAIAQIYQTCLEAEVAGTEGNADAMIKGLKEAVALQDKLPYMEPPFFAFPLRHRLGAAYVEQGQWKEAEATYREDLKKHPNNGWSLFGLMQCQRATGRIADAAKTEKQFRDAWKYSEVTLSGSAF